MVQQLSEVRYTPQGARIEERGFDGFGAGETTRDAAIPPGTRPGILTNITQINTKHGWSNKLWWEIAHNGETFTVTELASDSRSVKARFMRRVAALNGKLEFPKGVDLTAVRTIGETALVQTDVDERGFAYVVDVAPMQAPF